MRSLRGGDDAHRHRRELRGRGLRPFADGLGTLARDVAKRAPKGAETFPPGLKRDVGDRQIRVAQQRRGFLDTTSEQVAMRRNAEGLLELACEVRLGDAAYLREPLHGPGFVRSRVHAVLRAQQSAKKLRILR